MNKQANKQEDKQADKLSRINELTVLLNKAAREYYSVGGEIMSDYEYDRLYDELLALETETGYYLPESPTKRVGFEVVGSLTKVRHESRMLSLDKTKDIEKLKSFLAENSGLLSFKLDGLTIVLTYFSGTLKQAVTRGNGEIGEDITHNAKVFANLPKTIPFSGELILRGEAVISYTDFEAINQTLPLGEKYKNPRNLCSGTVRQLNSEICKSRSVRFYAFSIVNTDALSEDFSDSKSNCLEFLVKQGFTSVESVKVCAQDVEDAVAKLTEKAASNDFASDGLVLTYDSISYSRSLGSTSKFPKDSIAYKWADEICETELTGVDWNTSRTGLINPVAVFEPVEIEGTTVNRASIHNVSIFESLSLGKGDTVLVYKANMIIPQIADNLTRSGTLSVPDKCPVCGEHAEVITANEAKALYCQNLLCKARHNNALEHFMSRDAMNIEGFSIKTIDKFIEKGFLSNYSDIYGLERFAGEIVEMEGFGKKSLDNLLASIEQSKTAELHRFIYALGINQVGLSNAKLLCRHFGYDIEAIINAPYDELMKIDGFGETISKSIEAFFSSKANIDILRGALQYLSLTKPEMSGEAKLNGKIFVITGDVHIYQNRAELQREIEKNGGKVSASVSNKTTYLINNDNSSESSKNKKARQLNIPILTEEEFLELIKS